MCTRFTEEGTEYDDDLGVVTKLGTILDVSLVSDDHIFGLIDGEWHWPGSIDTDFMRWKNGNEHGN